MLLNETYFGVGHKAGGMIMAGVESAWGRLYNLNNPCYNVMFTCSTIKFGIGAGGGMGSIIALAFNIKKLRDLEKTNKGFDWGIGLDIGVVKASAIASAVKNHKALAVAVELAAMLKKGGNPHLNGSDITNVRNLASVVFNYSKLTSNEPELFFIDIPGAGLGAEVSVSLSLPLEGVKIVF